MKKSLLIMVSLMAMSAIANADMPNARDAQPAPSWGDQRPPQQDDQLAEQVQRISERMDQLEQRVAELERRGDQQPPERH